MGVWFEAMDGNMPIREGYVIDETAWGCGGWGS